MADTKNTTDQSNDEPIYAIISAGIQGSGGVK